MNEQVLWPRNEPGHKPSANVNFEESRYKRELTEALSSRLYRPIAL